MSGREGVLLGPWGAFGGHGGLWGALEDLEVPWVALLYNYIIAKEINMRSVKLNLN